MLQLRPSSLEPSNISSFGTAYYPLIYVQFMCCNYGNVFSYSIVHRIYAKLRTGQVHVQVVPSKPSIVDVITVDANRPLLTSMDSYPDDSMEDDKPSSDGCERVFRAVHNIKQPKFIWSCVL